MAKMTREDIEVFDSLIEDLKEHHAVFHAIAKVGYPLFDESIGTACVGFDSNEERVLFLWNPKFWANSSYYDKKFILCHEMLHIILEHLKRINKNDLERSNKAADVVVNHTLESDFNFNRKWINNADQLCWTDTVFPGQKMPTNESFEYYFGYIDPSKCKNAQLADDHGKFGQIDPKQLQKVLDEAMTDGTIDRKDVQDFVKGLQAGDQKGAQARLLPNIPFPPNPRWETVIDKWAQNELDPTKYEDRWDRKHIVSMATDCILPKNDPIAFKRDRIDVYFFLDTSGSCAHLAERFFAASKTLDPKKFKVNLCCFDTAAYDVIDGQLKGFGGTCFKCIENHIQQDIVNEKIREYPNAVFIITDGYGTSVKPEYPERWKWFLSEPSDSSLIPPESSHYMLKDYE